MKILEETTPSIPLLDMQDGQIAVITDWTSSQYVDQIVQRWNNHLIRLGAPAGSSWPDIFRRRYEEVSPRNRVRILPPGTKLEV
jgi:hypothetical protein